MRATPTVVVLVVRSRLVLRVDGGGEETRRLWIVG